MCNNCNQCNSVTREIKVVVEFLVKNVKKILLYIENRYFGYVFFEYLNSLNTLFVKNICSFVTSQSYTLLQRLQTHFSQKMTIFEANDEKYILQKL